jgi:hypothetical protein
MHLEFPEGYAVSTPGVRTTITLNGVDFTLDEFDALIAPREKEPISDHARRIAERLRIGCVVTRTRVS